MKQINSSSVSTSREAAVSFLGATLQWKTKTEVDFFSLCSICWENQLWNICCVNANHANPMGF